MTNFDTGDSRHIRYTTEADKTKAGVQTKAEEESIRGRDGRKRR